MVDDDKPALPSPAPSIEPPRRIVERPAIGRPRGDGAVRRLPGMPTEPFDWRRDDKQALKYLTKVASSISVVADHDGCAIATGYNSNDESVVEVFWMAPGRARSVAARARHLCPVNPEVEDAVAAIRSAAAKSRTTLTAHDVAIGRAREMAARLDVMVEEMQASGALKSFNREFKARRAAASAQGRGFMSYGTASARLRKMLAASLASSGGNARRAAAQFQLASVFETS
jgi:hypothetical protein